MMVKRRISHELSREAKPNAIKYAKQQQLLLNEIRFPSFDPRKQVFLSNNIKYMYFE